jgi:hypothetical protein
MPPVKPEHVGTRDSSVHAGGDSQEERECKNQTIERSSLLTCRVKEVGFAGPWSSAIWTESPIPGDELILQALQRNGSLSRFRTLRQN